MADEKYSALTDGGGLTAGDEFAVARASASVRVTPIGVPVLVYRYTVTGSDKASIDTGVDTAQAGSNDWANGDLLEIWIVARTDDAAAGHAVDCRFNNDSGSNYDIVYDYGANSSGNATQGGGVAQSSLGLDAHGSGGSANYPTAWRIEIPIYAGTTFYKTGAVEENRLDGTITNAIRLNAAFAWRSTSAITRASIAAQSTAKLKVGSQLLIYKRLAS